MQQLNQQQLLMTQVDAAVPHGVLCAILPCAPLCDNNTQHSPHARPLSCMTFFIVVPSCAGDLLMVTPAASRAAILSVALPLPPEMMAPAWPMRRPGGAVKPVLKHTYGQTHRQ